MEYILSAQILFFCAAKTAQDQKTFCSSYITISSGRLQQQKLHIGISVIFNKIS